MIRLPRMLRLLKLLAVSSLLLASVFVQPQQASAAAACACFFQSDDGQSQDCDFHDSNIVTEADCNNSCDEVSDVTGQISIDAIFISDTSTPNGQAQRSACENAGQSLVAPTNAEAPAAEIVRPNLSVDIPGVSFTQPLRNADGTVSINFIAPYIEGIYTYLLYASVFLAIVLVMVGGVQYILAAQTGNVKVAKERITNAVIGLVLLMAVYVILFTVNPQLTILNALSLQSIERVDVASVSGEEGIFSSNPACQSLIQAAHDTGTCKLSEGLISPSGAAVGCGYHMNVGEAFASQGGTILAPNQFSQVKNMDFPGSWDTPLKAPANGRVTYIARAETNLNRCGNTIQLETSEGIISICHVKDFTDENGTFKGDRVVEQGEIIGHLGGLCCGASENGIAGSSVPTNVPSEWSQRSQCKKTGVVCDDPTTRNASCQCQPFAQSGNTSGPHVHLSLGAVKANGTDVLACLK